MNGRVWWMAGVALLVVLSVVIWFNYDKKSDPDGEDEDDVAKQTQSNYFSPVYAFDGKNGANGDPKEFLKDLDELAGLKLVCNNKTKSFCQFFVLVQRNIPGLRAYVLTGLAETKGKQIDFVLFYHGGLDTLGSASATNTLAEGYHMTSAVLEKISPDLIGMEGCYSETCSWQNELADARRLEDDAGLPHFREIARGEAFGMWKSQSFYSGYAEKHPEAIIVGVDDYYCHSLDQLVMVYEGGGYNLDGGNNLRALLWRIRSEYALARMAHLLAERNLRSGAIVMGYAHGPEFKVMAEKLGIKARFFVTVPQSILSGLQEF